MNREMKAATEVGLGKVMGCGKLVSSSTVDTSAKGKADLGAVRKIGKTSMQALHSTHAAGRAHARSIREQDRTVERIRQKYYQASASWQRCLEYVDKSGQGDERKSGDNRVVNKKEEDHNDSRSSGNKLDIVTFSGEATN